MNAAVLLLLMASVGPLRSTQEGLPGPPLGLHESLDSARVSCSFREVDIRQALQAIARQSGVNLVTSRAVTGTLSLDLKNASLREALDAIVRVGGFEYVLEGSIVTVCSREELRERELRRVGLPAEPPEESGLAAREVMLLQLRYVDAERLQPVVEGLLGPDGTATFLKTADHVARTRGTGEARTPAPAGNGAGVQIGSRLSVTTQGQPARSHTLVVVDVPERLTAIREVVESLDVKPPQVLIEARFVEITLGQDHKLGIDWNAVVRASGSAAPHTFPFGNSSLGSFDPHVSGGSPGGIFPEAPDSVSTPDAAGLFTFGTLDFSTFAAVLEMIQKDARTQVVSNPRIVVDDRQTATILVGERFPILSTNISQYGTVTEELDHYEPIGVQLEVTPSVVSGDEIELYVRPSTSSLGPTVEGSSGLTAARINTRQIDTSVTARDRQTVVLGGLITTRESDVTSKVPLLGDIPLLGRLFTHRSTAEERIDLVVFLTVTILDGDGLSEADRRLFREASHEEPGAGERPRSALEFTAPAPRY